MLCRLSPFLCLVFCHKEQICQHGWRRELSWKQTILTPLHAGAFDLYCLLQLSYLIYPFFLQPTLVNSPSRSLPLACVSSSLHFSDSAVRYTNLARTFSCAGLACTVTACVCPCFQQTSVSVTLHVISSSLSFLKQQSYCINIGCRWRQDSCGFNLSAFLRH